MCVYTVQTPYFYSFLLLCAVASKKIEEGGMLLLYCTTTYERDGYMRSPTTVLYTVVLRAGET